MAEVGKNIKKIRKEKNLTQDELAECLHCTRQTISNYENGKSEPDIELLIEIARVLEVEINDLIYGYKKRENRKKEKVRAVITLLAALLLQAVIAALMPLAREYGWKQLAPEPMYLLRYVLRPFAMALFGWAVMEAGRELAEIHLWDGRSEKTRKIVSTVFYVLAGCMAVAAVMTLWLGVEMAYQWYLSGKMLSEQGFFSSSAVPHLMPGWLVSGILYVYVLYLGDMGIFGGAWFFLGAALAFFRIEKRGIREETGK